MFIHISMQTSNLYLHLNVRVYLKRFLRNNRNSHVDQQDPVVIGGAIITNQSLGPSFVT